MNRFIVRLLVLVTVLLGVNYLAWRWLESLNWSAWWIAVPLVLAETYSLIGVSLFGLTVWRLRRRGEAGPPPADATVDVLVSTSDEPVDLVLRTALAAQAIRHPHETWVLDDAARAELEALCAQHGLGYLTRGVDPAQGQRHSGAGQLDNALLQTQGEFLLVLGAGQVADPRILDRTLGWFDDPDVAHVQMPQHFADVPAHDPLGSQDPLFRGPVQQGRDGWNAVFLCGSNVALRREALLQLGLAGHLREDARDVRAALARTRTALRTARRSPEAADPVVANMLDDVQAAVQHARAELRDGAPLTELSHRLQREVDKAARRMVTRDFEEIQADLAVIAALDLPPEEGMVWPEELEAAVDRMSRWDLSPLAAVGPIREVLEAVSVEPPGQARPARPLATISVTDDLATSMGLHAQRWRSVYHDEILAQGPAPEDLGSVLAQRLRRAQATVQILLRENPLLQRRLSLGQRLVYFAAMWSCLRGFAAVVYFAAPVSYLVLGVLPVTDLDAQFFARFVPFLLVHQLLLLVVARGVAPWWAQHHDLALFPLWITAWVTAAGNVWFGRPLDVTVTPEVRPEEGRPWRLIRPQLVVLGLLVAALVAGTVRLATGLNEPLASLVAVTWVAIDLLVLSALVTAAGHRGRTPQERTTNAVHH